MPNELLGTFTLDGRALVAESGLLPHNALAWSGSFYNDRDLPTWEAASSIHTDGSPFTHRIVRHGDRDYRILSDVELLLPRQVGMRFLSLENAVSWCQWNEDAQVLAAMLEALATADAADAVCDPDDLAEDATPYPQPCASATPYPQPFPPEGEGSLAMSVDGLVPYDDQETVAIIHTAEEQIDDAQ